MGGCALEAAERKGVVRRRTVFCIASHKAECAPPTAEPPSLGPWPRFTHVRLRSCQRSGPAPCARCSEQHTLHHCAMCNAKRPCGTRNVAHCTLGDMRHGTEASDRLAAAARASCARSLGWHLHAAWVQPVPNRTVLRCAARDDGAYSAVRDPLAPWSAAACVQACGAAALSVACHASWNVQRARCHGPGPVSGNAQRHEPSSGMLSGM